jgi:hypothetical protein
MRGIVVRGIVDKIKVESRGIVDKIKDEIRGIVHIRFKIKTIR